MRVAEIVGTIKKFRDAGVEAPNQLYLKKIFTAEKYHLVMGFKQFAGVVGGCLEQFKTMACSPNFHRATQTTLGTV